MDQLFMKNLEDMGCDIDGTRDRFLNDEEFYKSCYKMAMEDKDFKLLGEALDRKDAKSAFEYAHTLKGMVGNLGLTPLYDVIVKIVEPLRAGDAENLEGIYEELMKELAKFQSFMR